MPIMIQSSKTKLMCGGEKIAKMYCEGDVIYSSGNIVTYMVDSGITYQEEVEEGASCLSSKTFTPAKSGWTFVGWRSDATTNSNVYTSYVMGDAPVTLYAVFRQTITVTYYNASASASAVNGYRYYNNGNIANASFALSQAALAGWTARGWSTSSAANGGITYADAATFTRDSNITLYGMYQQTIALTTVANGSTSAQYGTRYYNSNGNTINPAFTVSNPVKSGAAFLGWSSDGTASISNSTISNLTLSASVTRWAVFKYANSGPYTLQWTDARTKVHQGTNPLEVNVTGSPEIDGTKYETATIYSSVYGTGIECEGGGVTCYFKIGTSSVVIGTRYNTDSGYITGPTNFNDKLFTIQIPNQTNLYLQLMSHIVDVGYGFAKGGAYMGNYGANPSYTLAYITLTGRTVVG